MPNIRMPKAGEDFTKGQSAAQVGQQLVGAATAPIMPSGANPSLWQTLWESVNGSPESQVAKKYLPMALTGGQGAPKEAGGAFQEIMQMLKTMSAPK